MGGGGESTYSEQSGESTYSVKKELAISLRSWHEGVAKLNMASAGTPTQPRERRKRG